MTSAALDACLCLLLVSAAAVTVTSAPAPDSGVAETDRADAVAETLAATTADVPHRLQPAPGSNDDGSPEFERVAHGTLASLLADAAVRTVRVDGTALTGTSDGFADAVRETVRERLPPRTRVVVYWEPYPNAHLGRQFAVGPSPPGDADVHAETVRAPSGVDSPSSGAVSSATNEGFDALGRVVAESLVRGLFPPAKGRLALGGDAPVDDLVRHRYRRASEAYGVDTAAAIEQVDTRAANRRIATAMQDRVVADLRTSTESPSEAAASLELGTVEISVRTWSP
ncbi:DUF7284 family protein [Halolamina salifodinae]|uniref:Uncharacterized protein n=1 Tax=Halolamina salifodinae TaxID=1202767 RepID=A0A8T4GRV9_9EURY|nr:hypothetical protein [Halolamina salifodinae]MBP1985586.1 hypothetical protein [Halolamina salifodinae]